jgi:diguanylate cyclase (GGDEF)-like protein
MDGREKDRGNDKKGQEADAPDVQELDERIRRLNEQLQAIIHATIEVHELQESGSLNLPPNEEAMGYPRCWDEMQCDRTDCPAYGIEDYRCWLVAGTLCGGVPEGTFAKKHASCYLCKVYREHTDTAINALYENIGIVIQHMGDVTRQLRWLAIVDSLTGLYNRTYLELVIKREVASARRAGTALSLIIFDLDGFKSVNDNYGHLAGDEMLRQFGQFLQKFSRKANILFRLGGDEFLLLMNDTDEGQRVQAEKRYLEAINEWNREMGGSSPVPISFSLGGATASAAISFSDLMEEADRALYATKETKRQNDNLPLF